MGEKRPYKKRGKFDKAQMMPRVIELLRLGYYPKGIRKLLDIQVTEKTLMNHIAAAREVDPTIPYSFDHVGRDHLIRVHGRHLDVLRKHSARRCTTPQHMLRMIMSRLIEDPALVDLVMGDGIEHTAPRAPANQDAAGRRIGRQDQSQGPVLLAG